jgi:hypothetical protein
MRHKSEVASLLTAFYAYVQTQFQRPILALQTDNGREFDNSTVHSLLSRHGTIMRFSCPYTSQQNGKAERILRTLNDGVRALLFHASMPAKFWAEALSTSTFLLNRRPCRSTAPHTPHELLLGVAPDYNMLRVFGCLSYPNTEATSRHKLDRRSVACVFFGYSPDHRGYRCYDPVSRRVLTSRHVHFVEDAFPFATAAPPASPPAPATDSDQDVSFVPVQVVRDAQTAPSVAQAHLPLVGCIRQFRSVWWIHIHCPVPVRSHRARTPRIQAPPLLRRRAGLLHPRRALARRCRTRHHLCDGWSPAPRPASSSRTHATLRFTVIVFAHV